ncbi:hypothetical protein [Reinekea sp. G2M2-21]|uniref:hypothetical protein n=1 Tax=Reinekea sp. G2M2-21 TaxID=2788942 RepID=UPI0018A95526|nr:hypothetical protein [Reinekea sp. G2M2-21]
MNQAIHFKTSLFDVAAERENPINPIYGLSLLEWLQSESLAELTFAKPEPEDWGWYCKIYFEGKSYLIGSCALLEVGEKQEGEVEWVLQVVKHRSFYDKLLGREKMDASDPCCRYFMNLFESRPEFKDVQLG